MRVATATGQSPAALWRVSYRRTLYDWHHLDQLEYQRELHERSNAIYLGTLMNYAFAAPAQIDAERRKLLRDANLEPTQDQVRDQAESLLCAMAARGWLTVQ